MTIRKHADVSTGNVTQHDMELTTAKIGPVLATYEEGAVMYTSTPGEVEAELRGHGYSDSMVKVFNYALANDCHLIVFDRDAEADIPELDVHVW